MPSQAAVSGTANEPAAQELMTLLAAATGNMRLSSAASPVLGQVRTRLAETGVPTVRAYLDLIKGGADGRQELETLIARLTVGETFFFRLPEHFAALRDVVLPACLARNSATRQVRIWSAGCANGAEAYSIALVLHAALGEQLGGWTFLIVGSDINRTFLNEAEAAVYSGWSLRGVDATKRSALFEKVPDGWRLRDRYRQHVRFVRHNLVNDPVPSAAHGIHDCDVIFCRNVLLYFDDASQRTAVANLSRALVDGGHLFVAPTDVNPHLDTAFSSQKMSSVEVYVRAATPAPAKPLKTEGADPRSAKAAARRAARPRPRREAAPVIAGDAPAAKPAAPTPPAAPAGVTPGSIIAHADRGDFPEANRLAMALIEAEPLNAVAHYVKALVAEGGDGGADAEASLRRAIYLDRSLAIAHYHLALLRAAAGDRAAAHRGFLNVVDLLTEVANGEPASPDGRVDAGSLRALALHQLERLSAQ